MPTLSPPAHANARQKHPDPHGLCRRPERPSQQPRRSTQSSASDRPVRYPPADRSVPHRLIPRGRERFGRLLDDERGGAHRFDSTGEDDLGISGLDRSREIDKRLSESNGKPIGQNLKENVESISLGRIETPEDVAGVVSFFAGPNAAYVTGQTLLIDGEMLYS